MTEKIIPHLSILTVNSVGFRFQAKEEDLGKRTVTHLLPYRQCTCIITEDINHYVYSHIHYIYYYIYCFCLLHVMEWE